MPVVIFPVLFVILFAVAFKFFLCLFIYSDAKERSDIPALWVAVVFFVPDFIGLLLYFLIGRKRMVSCPSCPALMAEGSRFCPECGREAINAKAAGLSKITRRFLIAFLISLILLLVSVAALVIILLSGSM